MEITLDQKQARGYFRAPVHYFSSYSPNSLRH